MTTLALMPRRNPPAILVRCTREERDAWNALAAECGVSLAELVRTLLRSGVGFQKAGDLEP